MLAHGDLVLDVCPSFLLGGLARQETSALDLRSDNWGLAIDKITKVIQFVEHDTNVNVLVLEFEIQNLGQCQIPDVCLMIDALVYRPSVRSLQQADPHSQRYSPPRVGAVQPGLAQRQG